MRTLDLMDYIIFIALIATALVFVWLAWKMRDKDDW